MRTKAITIVYVLILGMIAYAANQGMLSQYVTFYREIPFGDDLGHFFLMGIFSFLATIASHQHRVNVFKTPWPLGPMVVLILVLDDYFSQILIATRTFSLSDLVADFLGIVTFAWLAIRFGVRHHQEES
jgi:VanZ family protein